MSRITDIITALDDAKREYDEIAAAKCRGDFSVEAIYGDAAEAGGSAAGRIARADNIDYMKFLLDCGAMRGKFQLIYADPPFFSRSSYQATFFLDSPLLGRSGRIRQNAYDDYHSASIDEYLSALAVRLMMMRELLVDTGCIVVHLDWHAAHYVRLLMDDIFGEERFVNEIIWTYKSGGASGRRFARKHDTLLVYSKTGEYKFNQITEKSYNRGMKPYRFSGIEEYSDDKGWYTLVNMKDVWQIDMVGRTSAERTGYATQKPEKLLERIVGAFSDEGDVCGDFFAGSGSLGAVCARMNRRWVMCDENSLAEASQIARLAAGARRSAYGFEVLRDKTEEDAGGIGRLELRRSGDVISLVNYAPAREARAYGGEENAEVRRYLHEDSLSLIKFWSTDIAYDGRVHRSALFCSEGERSVKLPERTEPGRVHVQGCDVFGNRFVGEA